MKKITTQVQKNKLTRDVNYSGRRYSFNQIDMLVELLELFLFLGEILVPAYNMYGRIIGCGAPLLDRNSIKYDICQ